MKGRKRKIYKDIEVRREGKERYTRTQKKEKREERAQVQCT